MSLMLVSFVILTSSPSLFVICPLLRIYHDAKMLPEHFCQLLNRVMLPKKFVLFLLVTLVFELSGDSCPLLLIHNRLEQVHLYLHKLCRVTAPSNDQGIFFWPDLKPVAMGSPVCLMGVEDGGRVGSLQSHTAEVKAH